MKRVQPGVGATSPRQRRRANTYVSSYRRPLGAAYHALIQRLDLLNVATLAAFVAIALVVQPVMAQESPADATAADLVGIPVLLAPDSGYVGTALTDPPTGVPTLRWKPVEGATRYKVQISPSLGFADPDEASTYATSFTPSDSLADGTYYWRVSAEQDRQWGNFSDPRSFTKDWDAAATLKPTLVEPAADAPLAAFDDAVFRWEPVIGAAYYVFEIGSSPDFPDDDHYYRAETVIPQHTPTQLLGNNTYYWRVTPRDNEDNAGVASEVRSFTFAWNRVPALLTPADDVDLRFLPRFSWEAVEGAKEYILEVSTLEDFSSISLVVTTPNTEYTPEKNLGNNRDFFWRVKAVNPRNVTGPIGEIRRFTLEWNQPPTLLTPASNSTIDIRGIRSASILTLAGHLWPGPNVTTSRSATAPASPR